MSTQILPTTVATTITTPIGYLEISVTTATATSTTSSSADASAKVSQLTFVNRRESLAGFEASSSHTQVAHQAAEELEAYFTNSQPKPASLPSFFTPELYQPSFGTPFQKAVWDVIAKIPFGQVMSYKEIAESLGNPLAYRAVANACGKNPLPVVIPCHRVVSAKPNGAFSLGGYSGGLDKKRWLLLREGVELPEN